MICTQRLRAVRIQTASRRYIDHHLSAPKGPDVKIFDSEIKFFGKQALVVDQILSVHFSTSFCMTDTIAP